MEYHDDSRSLNSDLFYTSSGKIIFNENSDGFLVLVNPKNSGVNIHLDKLRVANFTATPIGIDAYWEKSSQCNLQEINMCIRANLTCRLKKKEKAQFYVGEKYEIESQDCFYSIVVHPYFTYKGSRNGLAILPPNSKRIYRIYSLEKDKGGIVSMDFTWWEKPI